MSHENSITIEQEGRFINLPTVHDGKQLSNDDAVKNFNSGAISALGNFESMEQALSAAQTRSDSFKLPTEDDLGRTYLARRQENNDRDIIDRAFGEQEKAEPAEPEEQAEAKDKVTVGDVVTDVGRGLTEIPRALVNATVDAAEELTQNLRAATKMPDELLDEFETLNEGMSDEEFKAAFESIRLDDPGSTTGKAVQALSQFVLGFIPALRVTRGLKSLGPAGRITQPMVAGSLADVAVIDEQETRLANLIEEAPALQNPVTEFLATDEEDSVAEGKFKQAIEGLVLGAAADGLVASVKFLKQARRVRQEADPQALDTQQTVARAEIEATPATTREQLEVLGDPKQPLFPVTAESDQAAEAFLKAKPGEIPDKIANINLARIGGPEDVRQAIADTAKFLEPKLTRNAQANVETARLADEIAIDPERLTDVLTREGAFNAAEVTALRFMLHSSGKQLKNLAIKASSTAASDIEKFAFRRQMAFHNALLGQVSASARESGRALQAFKITAQSATEQDRAIREFMKAGEGRISTDKMAAIISTLDESQQVATFVRQSARATTTDMLLEAWINGLLSGPQTHAVNTLSNSIVAMWQIPERMLAAGIRKLSGGEGVVIAEAKAQAFGLVKGAAEGMRLAGKVLRSGEPSDVFTKIEARRPRAISSESFGLEQGSALAYGVDLIGEGIRVPGRLLQAEDELFKAVGYRMELNARATRQATQEGLTGEAQAHRIQEIINNPPDDLRMAAIDVARYQTFTKPLGDAGQFFTKVLNKAPALRIIMPFLRTPVNIMKFVGERTPLAPLSKSVRQEIAAGGARRDLALAKIGLGSMMMASFADMTQSGLITGNGPTDPQLRAALERTGWKPYAMLIGTDYVSYNRLDPIGATIGIAADLSFILGQAETADAEAVAAAAVIAVSQNIVSKTYMSGIADVMEIFASVSPELGASKAEKWIERLGGTLVPAASAQLARTLDPTLRQTQGIVDKMRSRIPGLSDSLPPRVNLWGEPIMLTGGVGPDIMSPLWKSPLRDTPVDEEMVRLDMSVSMPVRTMRGVEMSPLEYNAFVKLAGNGLKDPNTGLGARETLESIISGEHDLSFEYQQATDGPDGGKALIINHVIRGFREAARGQILNPESEHFLEAFGDEVGEARTERFRRLGAQ